MSAKVSKELAKHRLQQARTELSDAKLLFNNNSYLSANNRAYYSIFHCIRAVLALEPIDFKRHKDVVAYFNQHYINKEIFPKTFGRRISKANQIREDSDYDDEFLADMENTLEQIKTAEELLEIVEKYIDNEIMDN